MTSDRKALREALAARAPRRFTDNADVPIFLRYIGTQAQPAYSVVFQGATIRRRLQFYHGAAIASVTFDPTIGSGGIIRLSAAAYDTFGELVDIINASTNWRAMLHDARRANGSEVLLLHTYTAADTGLKQEIGTPLNRDTGAAKAIVATISAANTPVSPGMTGFLKTVAGVANVPVDVDAAVGAINKLYEADALVKYTGPATVNVYDGGDATVAALTFIPTSTSAATQLRPNLKPWQSSRGKKLIVEIVTSALSGDAALCTLQGAVGTELPW